MTDVTTTPTRTRKRNRTRSRATSPAAIATLRFDIQEVDSDFSWDVRRFAEEREGAIDALRSVADVLASIGETATKDEVDNMAELVEETNVSRLLARLTTRINSLQALQGRKAALQEKLETAEKAKAEKDSAQPEATETTTPDAVGGFVEVTEQVPAPATKRNGK